MGDRGIDTTNNPKLATCPCGCNTFHATRLIHDVFICSSCSAVHTQAGMKMLTMSGYLTFPRQVAKTLQLGGSDEGM
jgi:hypothetical protein